MLIPIRIHSSSNLGIYARRAPSVRYSSSRFQHLTVKTPLNPIDFPADMQYVRAEPYIQDGPRDGPCRGSPRELSVEGARSAVDSFKLLGLLLRPASRRKLQLLLKFMKRVSGNDQLTLRRDTSNSVLVLDMFVRIIIRYVICTLTLHEWYLCLLLIRCAKQARGTSNKLRRRHKPKNS